MQTFVRSLSLTFLIILTLRVSATPVTELRVMSFNIWVNGGTSLAACIDAIRSSGADLIGLQECNAATAAAIADTLGFFHLGVSDVSIVSRFPIARVIPTGGGSGVTVELSPGQRVHLFNVHLPAYPYGPYSINEGQSQEFVIAQEHQVRMPSLNAALASMAPFLASSEPCFLTGDFNAPSHLDYADYPWPNSIAVRDAGMEDCYRVVHPPVQTFPPQFAFDAPGITWTPRLSEEPNGVFDRIDFIYFGSGDGVTILETTELDARNSASPWPSDHRAVLSRVTVTPASPEDAATQPLPANGERNVARDPQLSWLPGSDALSHRVYFGAQTPGEFQGEQASTTFSPGTLASGATYFWRIDETKASGVVTGEVWSFTVRGINVYEWNFQNANLDPALGHGVLAYADGSATAGQTRFEVSDGGTVPHMNGLAVRYLSVPAFTDPANGYRITLTDSLPNGGGTFINQYSLVWDILIPSPLDWTPFFNTNPANANDADFYVDSSGAIGIGAIGYSSGGVIVPDTWHRIVYAADLAAGQVRFYVDGQAVGGGPASLDGRFSLYSSLDAGADILLFNEGDNSGVYTHPLLLSSFLVTDRTLTPSEILELGGPRARGIAVPPDPIEIGVGRDADHLRLVWSGGVAPFQLQETPSISPQNWQDLGTPTTNRGARVPIGLNQRFFRVIGSEASLERLSP